MSHARLESENGETVRTTPVDANATCPVCLHRLARPRPVGQQALLCEVCASVIRWPAASASETDDWWTRYAQDTAMLRESGAKALFFAEYWRWLIRFQPHAETVLDVGCGHGGLLRVASEHGRHAVGLELNSDTAQAARAAGAIDVRTCPLDHFPGSDLFDLIVMTDVYRHLRTPRAHVDAAARLLRHNGALVIRDVNVASARGRNEIRELTPIVFQLMTPGAARYLGAIAGFRSVSILPSPLSLQTPPRLREIFTRMPPGLSSRTVRIVNAMLWLVAHARLSGVRDLLPNLLFVFRK